MPLDLRRFSLKFYNPGTSDPPAFGLTVPKGCFWAPPKDDGVKIDIHQQVAASTVRPNRPVLRLHSGHSFSSGTPLFGGPDFM
jgi:hypothetical protein